MDVIGLDAKDWVTMFWSTHPFAAAKIIIAFKKGTSKPISRSHPAVVIPMTDVMSVNAQAHLIRTTT